ncbi:MAG: Gmad2 immunoglobulin-like domain-containing protein [Candidatus Gracilibacteria bacterium]|jgi:hypothetical protein
MKNLKKFSVLTISAILIASFIFSACQTAIAPGDGPETPVAVVKSDSDNIRIFSPSPEVVVISPLIVKGEARVFENQFSYQLLDEDGSVLATGSGYADAPDMGEYGPFEISIGFPAPKGKTGTLELFDYSAKDGSKADIASMKVVFSQ